MLGQHESISATYVTTVPKTGELLYVEGSWRQVLNSEGLTFSLTGSYNTGIPGLGALQALNYDSVGVLFTAMLSYPVIRTRDENLTLSGIVFTEDVQRQVFGVPFKELVPLIPSANPSAAPVFGIPGWRGSRTSAPHASRRIIVAVRPLLRVVASVAHHYQHGVNVARHGFPRDAVFLGPASSQLPVNVDAIAKFVVLELPYGHPIRTRGCTLELIKPEAPLRWIIRHEGTSRITWERLPCERHRCVRHTQL